LEDGRDGATGHDDISTADCLALGSAVAAMADDNRGLDKLLLASGEYAGSRGWRGRKAERWRRF
jgi:hypothetical protein